MLETLLMISLDFQEYQVLHEKYMSLKKSYSEQETVSNCFVAWIC